MSLNQAENPQCHWKLSSGGEYSHQIVQQKLTGNIVRRHQKNLEDVWIEAWLVCGHQNGLEAVAIEAWLVRDHQNDLEAVVIEAWLVCHHQNDLEEVEIEAWPGSFCC